MMGIKESKFKSLAAGLVLAMMAVWTSSAFSQVSVSFDGTAAPCRFASTSPLTDFYAPQGLQFQGIDGAGASILNQSGNFGFNARSGTDFLAFNAGAGTGQVEAIMFSSAATDVSIWAASSGGGSFTISAYDSGNNLLGTSSIAASTDWTQLSISAANIYSVQLFGSSQHGAYDDLSVTTMAPIPEPETYAMLLAGLGVLGFAARRRKLKEAAAA